MADPYDHEKEIEFAGKELELLEKLYQQAMSYERTRSTLAAEYVRKCARQIKEHRERGE